jgi:multisubunit Na+/H+ antiporter MnhE subunit
LDNSVGKSHIISSHGVELRVILGGIVSGTFRSLIETPLEYVKVEAFLLLLLFLVECLIESLIDINCF